MRKLLLLFTLLFSALFNTISFAQSCTLSGTYKIGPTGNYASLTAAVAALRAGGAGSQVILELQTAYTSTVETFPLTFNNIPCIDASRTITIRPETGASNVTITSNSAFTIDLSNARFIQFDGRPGGTGITSQLTIANDLNAVVRFMNDASFNSFSYVTIRGGGIQFLTSNQSLTNGNSNNTISQCTIYANALGNATNIYSQGTAGKKNTNNKILNNRIYNYKSTGAVQLEQNTGPWEISGNHLYYTISTASGNITGISINDSTSSGFQIHNNFIGGTAPNCGGTPNTYNAFIGIKVIAGSGSYTSIQGNTIANVKIKATWNGNYFAGISMHLGKFKCGDVTGNTIGSQTQNGNITVRGEDDFNIHGIVAGSGDYMYNDSGVDTCLIMNNKIGGMYGYQADFNFVQTNHIIGIYIRGQKKGYTEIFNNFIGSPATYSSMLNEGYSENYTYGIYCENMYGYPAVENKIINNEIAHLAGLTKAIFINSGKATVINNAIHHLYDNKNITYNGSPAGIVMYQPAPGTLISGNTIHSLTFTGQSGTIYGIYTRDARDITVEKNFIHSFQANRAGNANYNLTGIYFYEGRKQRIQNNMIRLGIDTAGATTVDNTLIYGIELRPDSSIISNNSVWIGGTSSFESAAMRLLESTAPGSSVRNNIFVNTRTVPGSSFYNHYALKYEGSYNSSNEFDYNIYQATGNRGNIAFLTVVPYQPASNNFTNIIDWRNATKQESHSLVYNPNFINPAGTSSTVNLHLANPNPAEGQGIADPNITDDIDHETRSSFSAVDIGADAGNFTLQDGDAPRISHKAFLGNPVPTTFVYTVTITDNGSGVDTTGNNKPRMWFRKKYPAISSWASLPGQFVSGNLNNGVWGFVPDFTGVGVPVTAGDSLEYYFAAQDKGPIINTGYSNLPGTAHANVNTQTTPPVNPLRLLIYGYFPDTVYVGAGQQYTSLTNDGGFFHKAKSTMFDTTSAHPTVIITSDLSESGTHEYTNINETGAVITFTTNTPVVKQIKHQPNIFKPLITFRNVKNIALDGRVNGSGRYLHFINGNSDPKFTLPALAVYGGGKGITLRNAIFESNGTANYGESVTFYSNDLDTLLIEGNLFKNIESSTTAKVGLPNSGLYFMMNKALQVIIKKNEFTNFGLSGVIVRQSVSDPTGDLLIDSNHFYYNSAVQPEFGRAAIDVQVNAKSRITNNFIGGSQPGCGGTPWTYTLRNTGSAQTFKGIVVAGAKYTASSVQNNTIQNIRILNWGISFTGIHALDGSLDIGTEQPNVIGSLTGDSSIVSLESAMGIYGYIAIYSSDSPYVRVENNIVAGITAPNLLGIYIETRRGSFKNNLVQNLNANGSTLGTPGYIGMKIWLQKGVIEGNRVLNLTARQVTTPGWLYGMDLAMTGSLPNEVLIARNKIAGLRSYWNGSYGSQSIFGMRLSFGQFQLQNNQINIDNGNMTNPVAITGIQLESSSPIFQSSIYYNTVRIGGSSPSNANTYAVLFKGVGPTKYFRNNILYNERTGGTGKHLALGDLSQSGAPQWPAGSANNNLFVVNDTGFVNEYRTTGVVNLYNWRSLSNCDAASYAIPVAGLPVDSLFADAATNDLNINSTSSKSWYVNGKGIPVESVSGDFDAPAGIRSTSIATGATDIGADEFNTATTPPVLTVTGNHVPGGTEEFSINERVVASITWDATGTLPNLGEPRLYTGVWPNDTTNNGAIYFARYMNTFWSLPASGGSNYSYSITFHYDSSMLGKVTDVGSLVINKKQSGVNGSWTVIQPTIVNNALKTITINNQTSFSEFTATDSNATLVKGVPSPDLLITQSALSTAAAATGTTITASFTEFNQGIAAATTHKVHFYLSADNILTPGANGDTLLGDYEIPAGLNINTGTGILNKNLVIPCHVAAGNYTLFFVADGAGSIQEPEENNNTAFAAVNISIGVTAPPTPVITNNTGAIACTPGNVTLTANSAGCTGCSFAWNTGATGNSITVNTSGNYIVTATNVCGQSAGSRLVTFNTKPRVSLFAGTQACVGKQVTLIASGAATYTWSGAGLNTTTSNVLVVSPATTGVSTYKVTGSLNGCSDSAIKNISVNLSATPSVKINYTGCPSALLDFSAVPSNEGTNPTYQWLVNNEVAGTDPTFTLNKATNGTQISVVLTSNATCANPATANASVTVSCITTAVPDIDGLESYGVLPNPSSGLFEIKLKFNLLKKVSLRITDINGRIVYQTAPLHMSGTGSKHINIRHLPAGVYYLQVFIDHQSFTDKLLKTN